jgi:hypothetical protein
MTKISCTECRERLGEVLAEEVAPVHAGHSVAPSSDFALLRAHLDGCSECARDLALLRGARAAMQSFTPQRVPVDLRQRIRAQIEREPVASASALAPEVSTPPRSEPIFKSPVPHRNNVPLPALLPRLPARHDVRDIRDVWDKCVRFFRRPANVAWASGLALAAFCLVLVARPGQNNDALMYPPDATTERAPTIVEKTEITSADQPKIKATPKPEKLKNKTAAAAPAGQSTPPAADPFAALPPLPNSAPFPFAAGDSPAAPPALWPQTDEPSPLPPASFRKKGEAAASGASPTSTTPAAAPAPLKLPSPAMPAFHSTAKHQNTTPLLTEPSAPQRVLPAPKVASAQGASDESPRMAFDAANEQNRIGAMRAAGPAAPRVAASSQKPASASALRAQSDLAANEARRDVTPVTRFITAHLKAPSEIGWGQVSVVLSGDAHFDDGTKARVVWRGSAVSGEIIEVGFSVSAPRGQYSARMALQQVQKGDAQTLTSTSIPITLR